MKISAISLTSRVKMYFDISCPITWASLKIIRRDYKNVDIDYEPMCDFKLNMHKLKLAAEARTERVPFNGYYSRKPVPKEEAEDETAAPEEEKLKTHLKDVPDRLQPELKENYKQIYEDIISQRTILPMLFLTGVKMHFPDLLTSAIDKIGSRLWEEELPAHKGCYLSTCAREIGMQLRESEFLISHLPHLTFRKELTNKSIELFEIPLNSCDETRILSQDEEKRQSPTFVIPSSNTDFTDVYRLKEFV